MKTTTPALNYIIKAFSTCFQNLPSQARNEFAALFVAMTSVSAFAQTTLGPYAVQPRSDNPLREPITFTYRQTPIAVDWDKDGDFDIAVADFDGGNGFHYLKNVGTVTQPKFIKWKGIGNPFYFTAYDDGATQAFSDLDKDGDLDMFLGIIDGTFRYYKNTNPTNAVPLTLQSGAWNATTKSGNPFYGIDLGDYASPYFIDLDNDNDDDLIIGTSYAPFSKSMYYYVNDGNGNFSESTLTGINPVADAVTPTFVDVDRDGNLDILTGEASGIIRYFRRTGPTSFEEQTGSSNPFDGIDKGEHSSPTAADFDGDGDRDIVIGTEGAPVDLSYYENKGIGIFEEKLKFENPFDGFDAGGTAAPYFTDFDNDNDLDLVVGNRSIGSVTKINYFRNDNGTLVDKTSESPFVNLTIPHSLTPSLIDLDGDGDKDLVGGVSNSTGKAIVYFKNVDGVFVEENFATGPFASITVDSEAKTDFVDIDNDGDFDLFVADVYEVVMYEPHNIVRFFKNTGTTTNPQFTEYTGTENPLAAVDEQHFVFPRFTDIDNDGDVDALVGEAGGVVENEDGNEFSFYENTGTKSNPVFTYRDDLIQQGTNPYSPSPSFVDFDNDGDKDIFIGDVSGYVAYYKNNNAAAVTALNSTPLNISGQSTVIDPALTVTDSDNDMIVRASVSILAFDGSEMLTFMPTAGIVGTFNAGTLQFSGVASAASYQTLLRSVTLEISPSSNGRKRTPENATISKTVTINVVDADGTNSAAASRVVNFISNVAPVFNDAALTLAFGSLGSIDLKTLVTDANGNANLSSFVVTAQPTSGAVTNIDSNGNLTINYTTVNFAGIETLTVQVSDTDGATDQSTITITVNNAAPVIEPVPVTTARGSSKVINLLDITSDPDNNLEITSIEIVGTPISGASAAIEMVSATEVNLTVDYANIAFSGTDEIRIRACDKVGSCTEKVISILVEAPSEIEIYNAVAPNSSGDNSFFRILNIPAENQVTIFNRWGDVVYKTTGYDNDTRRFEGSNNDGRSLPTGTYFYKIEYKTLQESNTLTGYLSLKQ